ncbi:MAG: alpha/beta hydrolase [Clostridiaceae bacterium]|jgi:alpha-beta hydrolase superfamily lysophospholipase|nr:alpha/beta hydrolase [Clostridiaceae bacterium]
MTEQRLNIGRIPALLWGEPSERGIVAVHGSQSHKGDRVIEILAQKAAERGYQVLSFDLPEHGDRKNLPELCKPELCIPDLQAALAYAQTKWREIALFANSLGAYFSLRAYPAAKLKRALFLSPLLDMERMIRNMMTWFHVSEERLRQEKEIPTPMGQTLYWDYYCDVKANPILDWPVPTDILYGEKDELCERDTVDAFLGRFGGTLEVLAGSEHFFHRPEQLATLEQWLEKKL